MEPSLLLPNDYGASSRCLLGNRSSSGRRTAIFQISPSALPWKMRFCRCSLVLLHLPFHHVPPLVDSISGYVTPLSQQLFGPILGDPREALNLRVFLFIALVSTSIIGGTTCSVIHFPWVSQYVIHDETPVFFSCFLKLWPRAQKKHLQQAILLQQLMSLFCYLKMFGLSSQFYKSTAWIVLTYSYKLLSLLIFLFTFNYLSYLKYQLKYVKL
jgi:hypothetical protein